jgi:hypothetical protein
MSSLRGPLLYAGNGLPMFPRHPTFLATMGPGERQSQYEGMRFVFGVLGSFAETNKQDKGVAGPGVGR